MKKEEKNGFTLIELVVVLVLLGIIMIIAIPSISSTIERHKQKEKEDKIKLIMSAAELYTRTHKNTVGDKINIETLVCNNLLSKEEVSDPFNETNVISGYVEYDKVNDVHEWKSSTENKSINSIICS